MITLIIDPVKGVISDKSAICNLFVNVGPRMDAKISQTNKAFPVPNLANSFVYEHITPEEAYFHLNQLNFRKANWPKNIPNKFLKVLAPVMAPYLDDIFNKCYETGNFSDILKQAKVIPIQKSWPKDVASNYRPISILSPVSMIFG